MNITFDTTNAAEVQAVIGILAALDKAALQAAVGTAPAPAPAPTPAPTSVTLPLIGFPPGSTFVPGNAFGTMPSVVTPAGVTLPAMVSIGSDGKEIIVPFKAPAPNVDPAASAAGEALQQVIAGNP